MWYAYHGPRRPVKQTGLAETATATPRNKRDGDAGARGKLIEATARVMREEGYAAATSRRVAAEAGVKQALVYYYFPTMDDLFVEVLRAGAEAALVRMRALLADDDPLRALWLMNSDLGSDDSQRRVHGIGQPPQGNWRRAQGVCRTCTRHRDSGQSTMVLRANGIDLDDVSTSRDLDADRADRAQPVQ